MKSAANYAVKKMQIPKKVLFVKWSVEKILCNV